MNTQPLPYTISLKNAKEIQMKGLTRVQIVIEEVGEFCYGVAIFAPGEYVPPHFHKKGGIITVDHASDGP